MPLRLAFETGALAGIHIVTASPSIRLGRDPAQNDILLTNPKVSRKHAVLEKSVRGGYSIEIIGTGPSKLNGDPIVAIAGRPTVQAVNSGDRVDFGGVEFQICEADVKLIVVSGPAAGRELMLQGAVRIGRGGDCDLVLADPQIADEHLVISAAALGFRADARAATLFNGAQGESRVLAHGDEIVIGSTTLRFTVSVALDLAESSHTGASTMIIQQSTNAVGELVVIAGPGKNDKIPLGDNQIILGSRDDCTYVLGDLLASPLHAAVSKEKEHFVVTDLGSESGTFVNGERIFQGTQLKPGDLIAIGSHVVEARLIGGVTQANRGNTIFSTIPVDQSGPQPKFVLDGRVVKARKILIGRAPHCDVIVDGAATSREHCVIEWSEGFVIRDTSSHGTYIDDKRIVKQHIPPQAVIRIGNTLFRTTVRGEVCTIERADAALAEAALDVARDKAAQLTHAFKSGQVPSNTMLARGGMGPQVGGEALRTIFRMDVGQLEQEIAARKKDKKRGAPAWRPSSDLAPSSGLRGTVVLSVIAAISLCGGALLLGNGKALVNHPLSAAHSSQAFVSKVQGSTVCAGCHSAGDRVDTDRCVNCHAGFNPRDKHHGIDCGGCHREHEGRPQSKPGEIPHALGAHDTCSGCHKNQHQKDFDPNQPAIQRIAAGPLPSKHLDTVALHAAHSMVKIAGPKGPKTVKQGIGCTSCHGSITAANGPISKGTPGLACFHCHDGGADAMNGGCERCHNKEHAATMARLAPSDPGLVIAAGSPSPFGSLAWALGLALVGGSPGLLLGAWLRVRRRRSSSKMVDELKMHPAEVVKRLVHSINDSKCVGCGLCVQACPASVLELVEHKSRVVNFDSCIQCKRCENACAFDALRMHDADKPPPMIPMPSIDAFHETPVPGLYLIGQASGTPQVKNATNLGRAVIQRMAQQGLRPGVGRQMGCEVDVIIVGSGPAGLAAALTCVETGLSYVVLEKERAFSWTIRNYYHKGKEVMAEPHDVALESSLPHWDSSREELLGAWQELVDQYRMEIRYQHNCIDVKKNGETFVVMLGDPKGQPMGQVTGARVVLAIGTLGNPRKLGCPGEELEKVKNSLVDPDEWRGKSIMIVGGSDSAVEVVMALCKPELGNKVWFSTRGAKLEGIKPKNMKLIDAALAEGKFQIRYATAVAEVTPQGIALTYKEDNRREDLPNDVVFAMIGGNSPQKWLQQLGIPYVDKPHSWSPPRTDHLSQKTAEGVQVQRVQRRPIPQRGGHH